MKKKICIITTSRAEYDLLKNLIIRVKYSKNLILQLIVSGTHLSKEYGFTKKNILKDKIKISKEFNIVKFNDSPEDISNSFAIAVNKFSEAYKKLMPDCIIILGDRYEVLAAAYTALIHNIPKIHIHGGERTEGVIDEATRHSITKISNFHFVSHKSYKDRVIQLGENPKNVFLVGAMAIENIRNFKPYSKKKLETELKCKFKNNIILVTLHPINLDKKSSSQTIINLLKVLKKYNNFSIIFTSPNQDTYGKIIIKKIKQFIKKRSNCLLFKNLGNQKYFSLIKISRAVVGNSSSGIIETPSLGVPTLNIGLRQRGRIAAKSVIHSESTFKSINNNLKKAVNLRLKKIKNPYHLDKIEPSNEILKFLKRQNFKYFKHEKVFYDLNKRNINEKKY